MMRHAMRTGGDLILPQFREPRVVHPPLVVLADISGSMSQYTRIFLHFLHALTEKRRRVHTFLFGTRLTNVTRQMRHRDPDEALADCTAAVRTGRAARGSARRCTSSTGNGRAGCWGRAPIVLLITDGLERDEVDGLSARDGAAAQILPAADLAQPAAALRRFRGAGARRARDAAACRRVPRRCTRSTRLPICALALGKRACDAISIR